MNKLWGKHIVLLLIAMLISGVLAACSFGGSSTGSTSSGGSGSSGSSGGSGGSDAQDIEEPVELRITWWGSQNRHDRTLQVIDMFQEQHSNIKIASEFTGWDGYWEKLATQAAGQNLPDIIQMDMQYIGEYTSRGLLEDLDPYVDSGTLDLSDVDDVYVSGGRIDGGLYGMNLGANALAMAIDPAMYGEAGVPIPEPGYTWDDLMEQARQLKQNLPDDVYFGPLQTGHEFRHYLRNLGLDLYSEDGTGLGYDDDQHLVDYFTMWDQLYEEGVLAPAEMTSLVQSLEDELIVHGQAPNHIFHSNQLVALMGAADRPLELVIYPGMEGGEPGHYLKPSQFFSITTHSERPEEAALFIDFFTNSFEANEALAGERGVPVASKVRDHLYDDLDEASKIVFDYMDVVAEYSREIPYEPPGAGPVMEVFDRVYEALSYDQYTPEEAAQAFRREAEEILQNNQ